MTSRLFEKFSKRALRVLYFAQEEAQRFSCIYIGTEFILLGLMHESEGLAGRILSNLEVDFGKVQTSLEFIISKSASNEVREINLTSRAKKIVELATDESHRMNQTYIGTEHLLLAILREGQSTTAEILSGYGVSVDSVIKAHKNIMTNLELDHVKQDKEEAIASQQYAEAYELRSREIDLEQQLEVPAESNVSTMDRKKAFELVLAELESQDQKWGTPRNMPDRRWLPIFDEEIGEVARGMLECTNTSEELIQVAAVAISWFIDRENRDPKIPHYVSHVKAIQYTAETADFIMERMKAIEVEVRDLGYDRMIFKGLDDNFKVAWYGDYIVEVISGFAVFKEKVFHCLFNQED